MNWKQWGLLLGTLVVSGALGGVVFYYFTKAFEGVTGWFIAIPVTCGISYLIGVLGGKVSRWFE